MEDEEDKVTKKSILIDLDSTFVDTLTSWVKHLNARFVNLDLTVDDINEWDFTSIPKLAHISSHKIFNILQEPGFTISLKPMRHAVQVVQRLLAKGNDIYFVTARKGKNHMMETFPWIKDYLPNFHKDRIIFCSHKHLIRGDVLVDDRPSTMIEYRIWNPNALVLGIEYEYNKTLKLQHIPLVKRDKNSWLEIEKLINNFTPVLNF